jgi:multicomponent Na+:H+ antiporter subunit F
MIAPLTIVSGAATLALAILGLAFLVTVFRIVAGPTLPDRVLALDMLVAIAIGFIAVIAVKTGFTLYIDIAISLGLVGFLATVAFARFILTRHEQDETASPAEKGAGRRSGLPAGAGKERKRGRRRKGTA